MERKFKVKKSLSGVAKVFRKWDEWSDGDVLEGKYIATHKDQYDKVNPVIAVEFTDFADKKFGKEIVGKNLVLNSCGILDKAFKELEVGAFIRVEYTGTATIEKGRYQGKEAHTMKIDELEEDNGADTDEDLI